MQTKSHTTNVLMPDDSVIEVTYYCSDAKLGEQEKEKLTQLVIQLHECTCVMKIEKAISQKEGGLESMVHNKVINDRGHLC